MENKSDVTAAREWESIEYLSKMCSMIPLSLSLVSFPMNLTVILIISYRIHGTPGRPNPGQIHLLSLAISDISLAIFFPLSALWLLTLPPDSNRLDKDEFFPHLQILYYYPVLTTYINRVLMMYITVKRTQCVFDIKAAEDMRAISTRQNVTHVTVSGILPGLGIFGAIKLIPDILAKQDIIAIELADAIFFVSSISFFGAVGLAMAIMATMIVTKIRANRRLLYDRTEFIVNGGGQGSEEAVALTGSRRAQKHQHGSHNPHSSYQLDNTSSPCYQVSRDRSRDCFLVTQTLNEASPKH